MVLDFHTWLYEHLGIDTGLYFGPLLSTVLPMAFWGGLFLNEVPIDLKIFDTTYAQVRDWLAGTIPVSEQKNFRILSALSPFIYTYLSWAFFDVAPATLIGQDLFKSHRFGTTVSLIISFIYTVTPSVLFAANYL
jgi:hypothetical protein